MDTTKKVCHPSDITVVLWSGGIEPTTPRWAIWSVTVEPWQIQGENLQIQVVQISRSFYIYLPATFVGGRGPSTWAFPKGCLLSVRSLLHASAAHGARMHTRNAALAIQRLAPATAMPAPAVLSAAQRPLHRERAPTHLCLSPLWQEPSTSSVFIHSSTIIGWTSPSRSRPSVTTRDRAPADRWPSSPSSARSTSPRPPLSDAWHEPVHP